MYIEEALNKGYNNDEITGFRILMEDPSLTYDLSKVSLNGGNHAADNGLYLNASISRWNEFGAPTGLNASAPYLYSIPNRLKESMIALKTDGGTDPFSIYIPNKQYTGTGDSTNLSLDMEIGRTYVLQFFIKFNNCDSATFSFFTGTASDWYDTYGLTFSSESEALTNDAFRWQMIETEITKGKEGTSAENRVMLNISSALQARPVNPVLVFISNLNISEKI